MRFSLCRFNIIALTHLFAEQHNNPGEDDCILQLKPCSQGRIHLAQHTQQTERHRDAMLILESFWIVSGVMIVIGADTD